MSIDIQVSFTARCQFEYKEILCALTRRGEWDASPINVAAWLFLAVGDKQPVNVPPSPKTETLIGNSCTATIVTTTQATSFTIECHVIAQKWKYPNNITVGKI